MEKLAETIQKNIAGRVLTQQPLSRYTTWRIGGPADILVIPVGRDDILTCARLVAAAGCPLYVIGNGSNVLVADAGLRGAVLRLAGGWAEHAFQSNRLWAAAGASLPGLTRLAARRGLAGLEFAAGIPASIGGAVLMNAGSFGHSLAEVVRAVEVLRGGQVAVMHRDELEFGYRYCSLRASGDIILGVDMELAAAPPREVEERLLACQEQRRAEQPLAVPTAGSVFKNPPGYAAGWLLEQVGAKGMRCGGAMVSTKHANFIVNAGGATCRDVSMLIGRLRAMVEDRFGIRLETEIIFLGE